MAKIETAIKEAIRRGARRQAREATTPLRREVRRLRRVVATVRRELTGLRDAAAQWQRMARATSWRPEVSEAEMRAARLSPRLVGKLRARLGLSQTALARLAGVSTAAVTQWERGRSAPSGQNRRALVALRKLGRRDVKRLLVGADKAAARPKSRRGRRRPGRPRRARKAR